MSILAWLKDVAAGQRLDLMEAGTLTFAEGEEQFHGLNMKDALDAHMEWTRRLEAKLNGDNQESLDVATVASDCECKLGKWIHGAAKQQFGEVPDFHHLRNTHAEFHLNAGEILNDVLHGNREEALANLKQLRYQSGNVQLALVRLYSHVHNG